MIDRINHYSKMTAKLSNTKKTNAPNQNRTEITAVPIRRMVIEIDINIYSTIVVIESRMTSSHCTFFSNDTSKTRFAPVDKHFDFRFLLKRFLISWPDMIHT